ncbi:MAG TPA: DUF2905 domain-containing protein [Acetomicrobium sp.]|jgi:hypothetical protein|uniref:DUF2905 domain-containing protein n=1 Tax=Acetomicrobium sp. TaxID=1872099 RepID=UPI002B25FD34|nr:DUF2905 domain-containing protein [Acetomicrobium sp.]HOM97241.1 DUF2905 domain-containing protein [Acetomicrobium sp.]HPT64671.1 DUF2905 domain-containing protein [Acetomicrobium sp.]
MQDVGKLLILSGLLILIIGVAFYFTGKGGIPLGRLPGDIVIRKKNVMIMFPIVSMLILSVILTIVLNLLSRWFR